MACGSRTTLAGKRVSTEPVQIGVARTRARRTQRPLPIIQDFHCADCGMTRKNRDASYHHTCPGVRPTEYATKRQAICDGCRYNQDNVCIIYRQQHPDRPCEVDAGVRIPFAACPLGDWHRVMIKCPKCERVLFDELGPSFCGYCGWDRETAAAQVSQLARVPVRTRDKLDDDCMVITAANQQFIRGAYFMIWTLLRANDVRVMVYLDDVPMNDPHVKQMQSWGVEVREMPRDVGRDVFFQTTWNKPSTILDALRFSDRVLWLDADTSISASVREAFDTIAEHMFIPNHGICGADNQNAPEVWDFLGKPRRTWVDSKHPCAGIIGVSRRDIDHVLNPWRERVLKVVEDGRFVFPRLNHNVPSPLRFHDQGVLQDLIDVDPVDGVVWSNFRCLRKGTIRQHMDQIYDYPAHIVFHYGGDIKPWFDWPELLLWPDPRSFKVVG